jgi:hypothetical protein
LAVALGGGLELGNWLCGKCVLVCEWDAGA